jgi:hypothetical protein
MPQTVGFELENPVPAREPEDLEKLMAEINPMFW